MNFNKNIIPFAACLICAATLTLSCTSNPFSNDQEIKEAKLSGQVRLSDELSPDSVYIWLEGFNLGTYTDSSGKFSILLPSPEAQGYGKGYNGEMFLYFYAANYRLDSSTVSFANGKLAKVQQDVNENGSLKELKTLLSLLQINTSIFPSVIHLDEHAPVEVVVKLKVFQYSLQVNYKGLMTKFGIIKTGMIFKSVIDPEINSVFIDLRGSKKLMYNFSSYQQEEWRYNFILNTNELLPGEYSVFPYIVVPQENVPTQLLKSIGNNIEEFGMGYLKLPMKRTDGLFEVMSDN